MCGNVARLKSLCSKTVSMVVNGKQKKNRTNHGTMPTMASCSVRLEQNNTTRTTKAPLLMVLCVQRWKKFPPSNWLQCSIFSFLTFTASRNVLILEWFLYSGTGKPKASHNTDGMFCRTRTNVMSPLIDDCVFCAVLIKIIKVTVTCHS